MNIDVNDKKPTLSGHEIGHKGEKGFWSCIIMMFIYVIVRTATLIQVGIFHHHCLFRYIGA